MEKTMVLLSTEILWRRSNSKNKTLYYPQKRSLGSKWNSFFRAKLVGGIPRSKINIGYGWGLTEVFDSLHLNLSGASHGPRPRMTHTQTVVPRRHRKTRSYKVNQTLPRLMVITNNQSQRKNCNLFKKSRKNNEINPRSEEKFRDRIDTKYRSQESHVGDDAELLIFSFRMFGRRKVKPCWCNEWTSVSSPDWWK